MNVLISGATRGIGKAIAQRLAKAGYNLKLLARNEEALVLIKKELQNAYAIEVDYYPIDLSDQKQLSHLQEETNFLSNINVLINNLGVFTTDSSIDLSLSTLQKQLEVNLFSTIQLSQALLPGFKKEGAGIIINIGSVASLSAAPETVSYAISKHALKAWNDSLREEMRKENIKVSAIYPGAVNTSSWDGMEVPREKMIQPKDIAELVHSLLLMSPSTLVEEIRLSPQYFK
jgi:short-subunit dehydrogenase